MNSGLECRESMCNLAGMETVDCQGFQLSPYAADLAEREGIDVGLIKRILDMSPRERIEHAQETAAALLRVMEVGKRFRNGH
jgi:hypothetical protein